MQRLDAGVFGMIGIGRNSTIPPVEVDREQTRLDVRIAAATRVVDFAHVDRIIAGRTVAVDLETETIETHLR